MSDRAVRGIVAALVVAVSGAAAQAATLSSQPPSLQSWNVQSSVQKSASVTIPKLDTTLAKAAEAATSDATTSTARVARLKTSAPAARLRISVPSAVPEVLADIAVSGDAAIVQAQLRQLGVTRSTAFSNLISAWVPADRLKDAAAIASVRSMRAPRVHTHVGTVTSQGDYLQRSQFLRAATRVPNLNGAGVTVGVLSDSFGCTSDIKSYADDVASGDLPNDVEVIEELDGCDGGEDEGRAMSQIVYDVAPGSKLKFASAFNGEASFAANIIKLANAGAKIIVDDVGYYDEPYFQDGIVAQAVDTVRAMGVAYYSSAGNSARDSYESAFNNSGVVGPAGGSIADERLLNFDTSGATVSPVLPITIPANASVFIYFEWDDPYATGVAGDVGTGAVSLLDMCLTNTPDGGVAESNIAFCSGPVNAGDDPWNYLSFNNPNDADVQAGLTLGVVAGKPLPGRIKIAYSGISVNQFATNSGTIQGHPAAKGASAVGAMYFRANAVCLPAIYSQYTLEDFSSSGGTPFLFDVTGVRLATPQIRQKPEYVAPDGGLTTFFLPNQLGARTAAIPQCSNPANSYNFFGTSAAAPHAAGVAALLLQAQPLANPDDLKKALQTYAAKNTSTIVSGAGTATSPYVYANLPVPNFDVGYGLIQADASLTGVLPTISIASSYNFGSQRVGIARSATLMLTNSGSFPLTLSSVTGTGDFSGTTAGCPASLAAGASCPLTVTFTPTDYADRSGSITLVSNAVQADGSKTVTVALSGFGTSDPDTSGGGSFGGLSLLLMGLGAGLRRRQLRRR